MVDRMSGAPYLRAGILRSFQQFLRQYPRDLADRILQRTGVGPMELANADARIRYDAATEALEMGAIQGGDDMFGLRFGQQLAWEDLGLLAEVLGNSATIGDALENVTRYLALQQTAGRPRLDISDGAR